LFLPFCLYVALALRVWDTEFRTGRRSTKLLFNDWTKATFYPNKFSKNILRYWLEHGIDNDLARWQ